LINKDGRWIVLLHDLANGVEQVLLSTKDDVLLAYRRGKAGAVEHGPDDFELR